MAKEVYETNFFDDLAGFDPEEARRFLEEAKVSAEKLDHLIHRTFEQNDQGKELLALWKESLIMAPGVEAGMDAYEVGIREGQKRFIRAILLTVKKVEAT